MVIAKREKENKMTKQRPTSSKYSKINNKPLTASLGSKIGKRSLVLNRNNHVKKNQKLKLKIFKNSKIVTDLNIDESLLQDVIQSSAVKSSESKNEKETEKEIFDGVALFQSHVDDKLIGQGKKSLKNLKDLNEEDIKQLDLKKKEKQKFKEDFTKQLELMGDFKI